MFAWLIKQALITALLTTHLSYIIHGGLRLHRGKLKDIVMQRLRDKKAFLTLYSDFVSLASAFHPELLFFTSSFLISLFPPPSL